MADLTWLLCYQVKPRSVEGRMLGLETAPDYVMSDAAVCQIRTTLGLFRLFMSYFCLKENGLSFLSLVN